MDATLLNSIIASICQALPAKPKKIAHPLRNEMSSPDDSIGPDSEAEAPSGTINSTLKRQNEG